jgi:predicted short-subunit dehydrogenase-like oxidoreductase (DUF2520 family)
MKVTIIGSGNVATVFAKLLYKHGHQIAEVYSNTKANASKLAESIDAVAFDDIEHLSESSDLYVIAVSDKAIETIVQQLRVKDKLTVHTAGSVSINILKEVSSQYGVLYPVQSIRKEMSLETPIPFAVDGSSFSVIEELTTLAQTLNPQVVHYNDEQRLKLHVAAVFSCNFVNYMYVQSAKFCANEQLDFFLLQSLIEETANRLKDKYPAEVFTGPAVRGDINTINKHLELLQAYPDLYQLYKMLSEQITQQFKAK